jgi:hypothetical protein
MRSFRGPFAWDVSESDARIPGLARRFGSARANTNYPLRDQKDTFVYLDLSFEKDSSNMKPQSMSDVENSLPVLVFAKIASRNTKPRGVLVAETPLAKPLRPAEVRRLHRLSPAEHLATTPRDPSELMDTGQKKN